MTFGARDGAVARERPWWRNGPLFLVLFTAIVPRLPHLLAPIVGWHSWRQADTAAIARNFHESGMHFLYPAVDWSGAGPGYVESEFPLFSYLVAALYGITGVHVVWGRALALLFSVGAALYLGHLCARYTDRWSAACAAAAFSLLPITSYIGVAFMPESLMLLASVAAIDHMDLWSREGRERDRWLSAAFLALAIAVKLPELFLGVPITYLVWRRLGWRMFASIRVWVSSAVALVPPSLWYAHANHLKAMTGLTFGIWERGTDKWGNLDLLSSPRFYSSLIFSSLIERHLVWAGAALLATGVVLLRGRRDLGTFSWWVGGAIVYCLVVARGNAVHDYYQLPVLLPLSLWIGRAIAWSLESAPMTPARIGARTLVVACVVLSLLRVPHFVRKEIAAAPLVDIGRMVENITPPGSLLVVVDGGDPTLLYHTHRKGWHADTRTLTRAWLEARHAEGAAYLVALAPRFALPDAAPELEMLQSAYTDRSNRSDAYVFSLGDPKSAGN